MVSEKMSKIENLHFALFHSDKCRGRHQNIRGTNSAFVEHIYKIWLRYLNYYW